MIDDSVWVLLDDSSSGQRFGFRSHRCGRCEICPDSDSGVRGPVRLSVAGTITCERDSYVQVPHPVHTWGGVVARIYGESGHSLLECLGVWKRTGRLTCPHCVTGFSRDLVVMIESSLCS
jgi:hypothetical protein